MSVFSELRAVNSLAGDVTMSFKVVDADLP